MLKYLSSAFFFSPRLTGIGRVPWNCLLLFCIGILGFAQPAFWLLGLGLEATYLFALTTNKRFRRVIDAESNDAILHETMLKTQKFVQRLLPESRARYMRLASVCAKIESIYQDHQPDDAMVRMNREALVHLSWSHLKLLVAHDTLQSPERSTDEATLKQQIAALAAELKDENMAAGLRASKKATLDIYEKRLHNLARRGQTIKEIESDLSRIEAQIDLALENARLQGGHPQAITPDIEVASQLLQDGVYGDVENDVAQLDAQLRRMRPVRVGA